MSTWFSVQPLSFCTGTCVYMLGGWMNSCLITHNPFSGRMCNVLVEQLVVRLKGHFSLLGWGPTQQPLHDMLRHQLNTLYCSKRGMLSAEVSTTQAHCESTVPSSVKCLALQCQYLLQDKGTGILLCVLSYLSPVYAYKRSKQGKTTN